jgi:ubiquitin-protein ligase
VRHGLTFIINMAAAAGFILPIPGTITTSPIQQEQPGNWSILIIGGLWHLRITIPSSYPQSPPSIFFTTRISHPNISFTTGEICLTLLTSEHWSPIYTISTTLSAIHQLLTDPRPESPLNVDVAALLRNGDLAGWESIVRYWTGEERWREPERVG